MRKKDVRTAIYWHLQALRVLGRKRVKCVEVAEALGLTPLIVLARVSELADHDMLGVKVLKGRGQP